MSRVYVGRLPNSARQSDLERFFKGFGKLKEVLMKNGYCFIEFGSSKDAEDAISDLDGKSLCGERVIVQMARARRERDDRNGGRNGGRDFGRDGGRDGRTRRPYRSRSRSPRDRRRSPRRRSNSASPPRKRRNDSRSESRSPIPKRNRKDSTEDAAEKKNPRSPSGSPGSSRSNSPQ